MTKVRCGILSTAGILEGNQELIHSFDNTLNNMHVIDACYASIETGKQASNSKV